MLNSAIDLPHASLGNQLLNFVKPVKPCARPNASRRLKYGPVLHSVYAPSIILNGARQVMGRQSAIGRRNLTSNGAHGNSNFAVCERTLTSFEIRRAPRLTLALVAQLQK